MPCLLIVLDLFQAVESFDAWSTAEWNPEAEVPMEDFLVQSISDEDKERLGVLGNVVVPPQASLAAAVLSTVVRTCG